MSEVSSSPEIPQTQSTVETDRKTSPTEASRQFLTRTGNRLLGSFDRTFVQNPTLSRWYYGMGAVNIALATSRHDLPMVLAGGAIMGLGAAAAAVRGIRGRR